MMKLLVLLSSYNGEKYLREQVDSLLAQTLDGVEILVRDDGSTDGTRTILEAYAEQGKLRWVAGNRLGPARSFWRLIQTCGDADYYAFCDQDDIWDEDKLEIAIEKLRKEETDKPSLYCGDVRVTDSAGRMTGYLVRYCPVNYGHALIRNLAPGCTYVFNRDAMGLLRQFDAKRMDIELHDWTVYQIIACLGQIVFDREPHMSYRQHSGNVIGASNISVEEFLRKVRSFWSGSKKGSRSRQALYLEQVFGSQMSPFNRNLTAIFAHYRTDNELKKKLLQAKWIKLQRSERYLFKLLVVFNRL